MRANKKTFSAAATILVLPIYLPIFSESAYGVTTDLSAKNGGNVSKTKLKKKLGLGRKIVISNETYSGTLKQRLENHLSNAMAFKQSLAWFLQQMSQSQAPF